MKSPPSSPTMKALPVDGELSQPEQRDLLVRMENDETLRERVCDLRNTKNRRLIT